MKTVFFSLLVASLLVMFFTLGESIQDKSLVLNLPFDEGAGDKVKDKSHNGNDGIVHNCKWVDGKFGSALEFDGTSNSFVEVPDFDTLASFQALTVSVWVKAINGRLPGAAVEAVDKLAVTWSSIKSKF